MMKVYIRTLGCEKNTVDSENAARLLIDAGCSVIDDPEEADVLIVNTCGFIGDAKKQSIEAVFELNAVKEASGGKKTLIVCGCLTQRYAEDLKKSLPEADFILGVNDYVDSAFEAFGHLVLAHHCKLFKLCDSVAAVGY